jgi:prepilin-type N-terminal cleavage/methylation domain-containing protein
MRINKSKRLKAYSLLEMLVTLAVFAVLLTMIINVLLLSIEAGRKIASRSRVRGDLSEISVMIRRDFRNASKIDSSNCGPSVGIFSGKSACIFNLSGVNYAWVQGDGTNGCPAWKICKMKESAPGIYSLFYQSSEILEFQDGTKFEVQIYNENESTTQGILLATLLAVPPLDSNLDVPLQIRQVNVFARNF